MMADKRKTRRPGHPRPRFLRSLPSGGDVYLSGPSPGGTMHVLLPLRDSWPDELKQAVQRRRRAMLFGQCECGAKQSTPRQVAKGIVHAVFEHESDCEASDDAVRALF